MFLTSPQQRRRQAGSAQSSVQSRMLFQITWSFLDKAMKGACEGTLINFTQSCCPKFVTWQSLTNPVLQYDVGKERATHPDLCDAEI